ncbi:AraC family transcriptional regulator [Aquimarina sp. U1-2]|uniref:helix-turn-helix domain-containing protein n=1 Tax=Aquimarina sp. U1-2 TaxID=2823141 RepID=UPI001AECE767|nr:helix-turn-helix domain-containing protein [Aquimarina sp. U1-2]MBP2831699.1 AraC family transcriptional regulator [Aquimarina sp. U1-2]
MLLTILLIISIFQGIVLGTIILKSPLFRSNSNKYLAYAIFSISISLLNWVLDENGLYEALSFLRIIDVLDFGIVFPVFIHLYVIHVIDHPTKNSKRNLWLFIPFLFINTVDSLSIIVDETTSSFSMQMFFGVLLLLQIIVIFFAFPGIVCYTYTFLKFSKNVAQKKWLIYLWLLTCGIFISFTVMTILGIFTDYEHPESINVLILLVVFLIHWMIYRGIYQFKLASDQEEISALFKKIEWKKEQDTISNYNLAKIQNEKKEGTFTEDNDYFQKLEDLCVNELIYKDSTLDRDKVAELLGISPGYVSQIVNTISGNNFATYINRFRVEAVKRIIVDPEFDKYNLVSIGLECGFSSKTTFHTAFKKITGLTPNAYRNEKK